MAKLPRTTMTREDHFLMCFVCFGKPCYKIKNIDLMDYTFASDIE